VAEAKKQNVPVGLMIFIPHLCPQAVWFLRSYSISHSDMLVSSDLSMKKEFPTLGKELKH